MRIGVGLKPLATYHQMLAFGVGGGKPIFITALSQTDAAAQVGHRFGEVAHGEVGFRSGCHYFFQFTFATTALAQHAERTAGEIFYELLRGV